MPKTNEFHRYLPVSPLDVEWGIYVTGAGYANVAPSAQLRLPHYETPPAHKLDWKRGRIMHEYCLVYIAEGTGEFESRVTGRKILETGAALFVFPEVWHRYRPIKETGWCEYWVTFLGEQADRLRQNSFITPENAVLNPGLDDSILHTFKDIVGRLRFEKLGFQHIVAAETLMLIAMVLANVKNRETSGGVAEWIIRAKAAIEEQVHEVVAIDDLASSLGLSGGYFRQIFKRHTGLSPYQYHLQVKINHAKHLLRASDLTIKQISGIMGFQNVFHFSKLFKNKTSMTPNQWRSGRTGTPQTSR
jgi:AraC-like DNA-binding protein